MKKLWLLFPIAILLLSASAQETDPPGFEHWTPASLKRFENKMHADASPDPHHFAVELLADFPNDSAMLVHRESDGQAEWHETQVDVSGAIGLCDPADRRYFGQRRNGGTS